MLLSSCLLFRVGISEVRRAKLDLFDSQSFSVHLQSVFYSSDTLIYRFYLAIFIPGDYSETLRKRA